jgi:hypothetical protein
MSPTPAIPLLRAILPYKNLLAAILFDNSRFDLNAFYRRPADLYLITIRQEQDVVEFNLLTDFEGELLYGKAAALLGAVLPTTTFYNCVHGYPPKKTAPKEPKNSIDAA